MTLEWKRGGEYFIDAETHTVCKATDRRGNWQYEAWRKATSKREPARFLSIHRTKEGAMQACEEDAAPTPADVLRGTGTTKGD